jgi:hypothetical protein
VSPVFVAPTPLPAPPEPACVDDAGWPSLCEWQLAQYVIEVEGAVEACNVDKAEIARLTARDDG